MLKHSITVLVVTSMIGLPLGLNPALADNPMGYKLLSADQASGLPRMGGALGMSVGPDKQITDDGMTFELLRVNGVGQNSAGGQAGFRTGDEIISVDGHVFPSVAAFAGYVGSIQPGRQISVDYIPAGGGPQQAQRIDVTLGEAGRPVPAQQQDVQAPAGGMSTGTKVAIGVGAAALLCYKYHCYDKLKQRYGTMRQQQQQQMQSNTAPMQ